MTVDNLDATGPFFQQNLNIVSVQHQINHKVRVVWVLIIKFLFFQKAHKFRKSTVSSYMKISRASYFCQVTIFPLKHENFTIEEWEIVCDVNTRSFCWLIHLRDHQSSETSHNITDGGKIGGNWVCFAVLVFQCWVW